MMINLDRGDCFVRRKIGILFNYFFFEPILDKGFSIAGNLLNRLTCTAQGEDLHHGKSSHIE